MFPFNETGVAIRLVIASVLIGGAFASAANGAAVAAFAFGLGGAIFSLTAIANMFYVFIGDPEQDAEALKTNIQT